MKKILSFLLILSIFTLNVNLSFGQSQNNDEGFVLNNDNDISYYLAIKNNFTRDWRYIEDKASGDCTLDEYGKLLKEIGEEVIYKSKVSENIEKTVKGLRDIQDELNKITVLYGTDGKIHTEEEKIKAVSEIIGKIISKLIFVKVSKENREKYIGYLSPFIENVVSKSIKEKKGMINLSNKEISTIIFKVLYDVLTGGIEISDSNSYEDYLDMSINIVKYLNSEVGLLAKELKFGTKCVSDIIKTTSNIKKFDKNDYNDTVFLLARESAIYLLSSIYGIKKKIDKDLPVESEEINKKPIESKEYFKNILTLCSNQYESLSFFDWVVRQDYTYVGYIKKYCGVTQTIDNKYEFEKYPFSDIELNFIAINAIKRYLSLIKYPDNEKNINSFLYSKLSKDLEYIYTNDKYANIVNKNYILIDNFLKKREKQNLIDKNCDIINDLSKKSQCTSMFSTGTFIEQLKYIQSNSGVLNIDKPQNTDTKEEKTGFFQSVTNIFDSFVGGVKSVFKKTINFVTGSNEIKIVSKDPISIGKIKTPNGKEFEIINEGDSFTYNDPNGTKSKTLTSIVDIQKELNKNNSLTSEDYTDKTSGKVYKITNYNGVSIIDEKGNKIDKDFNSKDEAIVYITNLNLPTCDITIKSFVDENLATDLAYEDGNKKYLGKNMIINFKTLSECKGGKLYLKSDDLIPGTSGNKYGFIDFLAFRGGGGPNEENPIISNNTVKIENNSKLQNVYINIDKYKNGKYDVRLFIGDLIFIPQGEENKDTLDKIINDFKLIGSSLNINIEIPVFSWNTVNVDLYKENHSEFLSCMSNLSSDEFKQKFGNDNQNGFYAVDSQGLGKVLYIKGSDKFADCCRMGINCEFKLFDKSKNSIVVNRTAHENYGGPMISDEMYFINVSNGKVTLKK